MTNLNGVVNVFGSAGNSNTTSQLSLSYLDQRYLDVAGGDKMLVNLDAGNNKLVNLGNPTLSTDGVNKNYVDTSITTAISNSAVKKKSLIGLFPSCTTDNPKNGWIITSNSEYSGQYLACNVTNPSNSVDWASSGVTSSFWVQIQIPNIIGAVEPYMFIITGRTTSTSGTEYVYNWMFQGSNDNQTWTTIYQAINQPVYNNLQVGVQVNTNGVKYVIYRLFCANANPTNPGLSYFQVYYYL